MPTSPQGGLAGVDQYGEISPSLFPPVQESVKSDKLSKMAGSGWFKEIIPYEAVITVWISWAQRL